MKESKYVLSPKDLVDAIMNQGFDGWKERPMGPNRLDKNGFNN